MARWTLAGSLGYVAGPLVIAASVAVGAGWRAPIFALGLCARPLTVCGRRLARGDARAASVRAGLTHALSALRRRDVSRWLALLEAADLLIDVFHGFLALYFVDVVLRGRRHSPSRCGPARASSAMPRSSSCFPSSTARRTYASAPEQRSESIRRSWSSVERARSSRSSLSSVSSTPVGTRSRKPGSTDRWAAAAVRRSRSAGWAGSSARRRRSCSASSRAPSVSRRRCGSCCSRRSRWSSRLREVVVYRPEGDREWIISGYVTALSI